MLRSAGIDDVDSFSYNVGMIDAGQQAQQCTHLNTATLSVKVVVVVVVLLLETTGGT